MKLVALDLDGTLLPSDKRLTERARRVIHDLGDAGIAVTLATGRGWRNTERYGRELELAHPLVAFEGALVASLGDEPHADAPGAPDAHARAPGDVLHHRMLGEDRMGEVLRAVTDLGLGYFVCTERHHIVASERLRGRIAEIAIWDPHVRFVAHADEPGARGYVLHLLGPPADVAEASRRIDALALGDVDTFHWDFWDGWDQLQVRPAGIGKDVGLRHVLDSLALGPEHLLAAGDWHNDLGMLRMARVAVAPANAVAEVREVADHVLDGTSDDDAVVRFLEDALRAS